VLTPEAEAIGAVNTASHTHHQCGRSSHPSWRRHGLDRYLRPRQGSPAAVLAKDQELSRHRRRMYGGRCDLCPVRSRCIAYLPVQLDQAERGRTGPCLPRFSRRIARHPRRDVHTGTPAKHHRIQGSSIGNDDRNAADSLFLPSTLFSADADVVVDMAYRPAETPLLRLAKTTAAASASPDQKWSSVMGIKVLSSRDMNSSSCGREGSYRGVEPRLDP
jgi:hypothetical protein